MSNAEDLLMPAMLRRMDSAPGDQLAAEFYRLRRPAETAAEAKFTAIDLFSGAGGITLGLANAGFRVLLASDRSVECAITHHRNMPDVPFVQADISVLSAGEFQAAAALAVGELDLLIGGPPCQGFSILGQRDGGDPRNGLIDEFFKVAEGLKPKFAVIENVPGLATLSGGRFLQQIAAGFTRLGYRATCAELLAAQYGVPQMRWRMFFVGVRADTSLELPAFPLPTHGQKGIGELVPNRTISPDESAGFVSTFDAIGDLPPVASGSVEHMHTSPARTPFQIAMRAGQDTYIANHYAPRMSLRNLERFRHLKPGQDWRNLPRELLPAGMQRALLKDHTRRFRRMTWDGVPRSIITRFRDPKSGEYIHPDQDRTISIREAARIQAFPDWFVFEGSFTTQYEQVGNAVPTLLARAIALQIGKALEGRSVLRSVRSRYRMPA